MKHNHYLTLPGLSVFACALLAVSTSPAQSVSFDVIIDTSMLRGHPAGPFFLNFQLTDGCDPGDATNMVTVSNFQFEGGSAVGEPLKPIGGASGNLASSVSLTDSSFLNDFTQQFSPGNTLRFSVNSTVNFDAGPTPDGFSFSILDSTLTQIPSTGLGDASVFVNINSTVPEVLRFHGDSTRTPAAGGDRISIPAADIPNIPDASKPSCAISEVATDPEGKKFIEITAQDLGSGLASLRAITAVNVATSIPIFAVGITDPLVVTATKLNQDQASNLELEVTDVAGNVTVCTPVVLSCSSEMATAGPGQCSAVVNFHPGATDLLFGTASVVCAPPSGATFPIGITTVTCSADDLAGNHSVCTFAVTVVDATPPTITCPADLTVECDCPEGTGVNYSISATDACDPNPTVNCTPPSGTLFSPGSTTVICTATDHSGNRTSCSFPVTVVDTTLRITDITIEPDGRVRIRFFAKPNSQYALYRGDDVTNIGEVTQFVMATSNFAEFVELFRPADATFYRVAEVP